MSDPLTSKEQVERFEIWSVSHDGMAELARQRAGMGPTDFEQYIPKCDRDVFVRWEDYDRLADEIKRLDADACNERAEKESWRAIAETRTRELAEARNASVPGSATVFAAVEAERDRLRAALKDIASHLDESYRPGCLERILGDKARAALSGEPSAHETAADLPGDGTRRAAFNAWWQEMWKDNDPRSSPGFDEQMRSWSLDAWQAGAAHERDRISAMRPADTAEQQALNARGIDMAATKVESHGIEVHVGDDGAWVTFHTKSGKHFSFQPAQEWPFPGRHLGADPIHDWCAEMQAIRSAEKANECKPGFTQACSSFGDDPDAPGCCSYCGQPREAHPQKGPV